MNAKQLRELADELFTKKQSLTSLHQEIAEHFYCERADFTVQRSLGSDFGANLMSSYPMTCRRELANQFGTMLRPTAKPWFHTGRRYIPKDDESTEVKAYLEWFTETQRRAMYDPGALLTRATKEGDNDFACFGQAVLSVELNRQANGMLFRGWHLRDVVWQENEEGKIGFVARKWKPTAQTLKRLFGSKIHRNVEQLLTQNKPFEQVECYHFVVDADMYDDNAGERPRWSIYYDSTHDAVYDATPIWGKHYVIPRWQTVSGSQYAYSPAAVCALPDARLIQAMTYTLLEAGEKATSPPMIATQGVVKSDVALYAGGITWVDEEYDEREGAALRPLEQDLRGMQYGLAMAQDSRALLNRAFFLDALTPITQGSKDETAYEVGQRVQKYIRDALPIFEPVEQEYNAALCEETFEIMWRVGAFGDPRSWPKQLRGGTEIEFTFESPLHDLIEQQKGQLFQQSNALIGAAIALDPTAMALPKTEVMLRDALHGIGVPAAWMNTEAEVRDTKARMAAKQAQAENLANIEQASVAAKNIGQSGLAAPPVA